MRDVYVDVEKELCGGRFKRLDAHLQIEPISWEFFFSWLFVCFYVLFVFLPCNVPNMMSLYLLSSYWAYIYIYCFHGVYHCSLLYFNSVRDVGESFMVIVSCHCRSLVASSINHSCEECRIVDKNEYKKSLRTNKQKHLKVQFLIVK